MQNHKKHHLRAPLRYIIHIHTATCTYESVYMYLKVFPSTLTYSLPTYRESLLITIKDTSTTYPKPNPTPRIQYLPTYLVHSTNHLTLTLQALIPTSTIYITYIHRGRGVRRQVVYQTVTATLDFDKGYDSS